MWTSSKLINSTIFAKSSVSYKDTDTKHCQTKIYLKINYTSKKSGLPRHKISKNEQILFPGHSLG